MIETRVKICGLRKFRDLQVAVEAGADAVGFVVGSLDSPRNLSPSAAARLVADVPPFVESVLVTRLTDVRRIEKLARRIQPNIVQVHDERTSRGLAKIVGSSRLKIVCGVAVKNERSVSEARRLATFVDAVMGDSVVDGVPGGTGVIHNWRLSRRIRLTISPTPFVLAGGLKSENVARAVRLVQPYAVDVSSGVEKKRGVKDPVLIRRFVDAAKRPYT